jgi:hypothetical protein
MSAYKIKININNTPEQEVFVSFQCSVLSPPVMSDKNISFNSQAVEFNGKIRTEIPITCTCPVDDSRMSNKINKLQKGNRIEIIGNLIHNDKEEIIVLVTYLVYFNANNFSVSDKKDLSKIPWLDSNSTKKNISINEDQQGSHDVLPNFIMNKRKNVDVKNKEVINLDDNDNDDNDDDDIEGK